MLLCLPQAVKNSKRYWKRAMNLSLPLLLARKSEKKMEKLLVRTMISRVISFVSFEVARAWFVRSWRLPTLLNDIDPGNNNNNQGIMGQPTPKEVERTVEALNRIFGLFGVELKDKLIR